MKKLLFSMSIISLLFASCEGDQGPPGPPGQDGLDGIDGEIGTTLQIEGIDFNEDNDYSQIIDFETEGIEVFEDDAVLVYLKDGEDGEAGGLPVEVFRQLPQTYYVEDGEVQYNFDFTFFDVNIFMDGTADFSQLDPAFTQDQIIRIVIVPATFAEDTGIDVSNFNAVMNALDLDESDVKNVQM